MTDQALLRLVLDTDDSVEHFDALDAARDQVRRDVLPGLAAAYPTLDWRQRRALVVLVQDHIDPATRSLMQDFVSHSPRDAPEQEAYRLARAIARCHLDGSFDAFSDYLAHPELVERRARGDGA